MNQPSDPDQEHPPADEASGAVPVHRVCPKCAGSMSLGFVPDWGHNSINPSTWVEGAPERSFWTTTRVRGKQRYLIDTYRCEACGYVESFALRAK